MTVDPAIEALIGEHPFDSDAIATRNAEERDRRIHPHRNDQFIEVRAEFSHYAIDPNADPDFQREPLTDEVEVLIIGAGLGGLLCGARLRQAGVEDIRIVDKANGFGGTWYWNRYPGLHCDTEAYVYLPLLEELGYMPSRKYAPGSEIRSHCENIARHYRLHENACLQTAVTALQWNGDAGCWTVRTDRGDAMSARYVLMAVGPMDCARLPGIPGIGEFRGHTFHTSRWDYAYTGGNEEDCALTGLADKRVGVVGTACTGVQCIPHIARHARHLTVFQRTPAAVDVRANRATDPDWAASLKPGWQAERSENFNRVVTGQPAEVDLVSDGFSEVGRLLDPTASWASSILGRELSADEGDYINRILDDQKMEQIRARVDEIVTDPATAGALKPWHRRWCKRPEFSDDYLPTFNRDNVTLVDTVDRGMRFTGAGAVVGGEEYQLDCVIFATGFEVGTPYTQRTGYTITGRDGLTLARYWEKGMRTMNGLHIRGFPNCFYVGLGQNAAASNFCFLLDEQSKHAAYIIAEAKRRGARTVEPTERAVEDYVAEVAPLSYAQLQFWKDCTPSYFNGEGDSDNPHGFFANVHPGGTVGFYDQLRQWREDGTLRGLELDGREPG